jgi:hypothetical protein
VCERERERGYLKIIKMQEGEGREYVLRTEGGDLWKEEMWKIGPQIGQLSE